MRLLLGKLVYRTHPLLCSLVHPCSLCLVAAKRDSGSIRGQARENHHLRWL